MAVVDVFPALFDNYFIKIIFLIHASLISLANIAGEWKLTHEITYTSYNYLFLLCILLAILVDKNTDIVLVATVFNVICIALDVVLVIAGAPGLLSTLLIVLNLLFRPISSILLLKNYSARAGVEDPTSGILEVNVQAPTMPRARSAYQNIDEPNQTLP